LEVLVEEAVGVRDKCGLEFPKVFQNGGGLGATTNRHEWTLNGGCEFLRWGILDFGILSLIGGGRILRAGGQERWGNDKRFYVGSTNRES
jgi:hypothetical protein